MARRDEISAGLLAFAGGTDWNSCWRIRAGRSGRSKDDGAWTIPKGLVRPDDLLDRRAPRIPARKPDLTAQGPFVPLKPVRQKSGKTVHGFAFEADFDLTKFASNMFEMEWPPRSGQRKSFPEIDRIGWFGATRRCERSSPISGRSWSSCRQLLRQNRITCAHVMAGTMPAKIETSEARERYARTSCRWNTT